MNLYALYGLNFLFQVYCLKLNLTLNSCNTKSHEVLHRIYIPLTPFKGGILSLMFCFVFEYEF